MNTFLRRYYMLLLLVTLFIEANSSNNGLLKDDAREPRVSGRIVKLYTGSKPEPVGCTKEGFQSDPHDCAVFYRCVKSGNGKYTVFRFQCGPGTVYDPDVEICNHPRSTKRSECGGLTLSSIDSIQVNEVQQELPSPIQTKKPVYTERTSTVKYFSTTKPWVLTSERTNVITPYPFITSTKSQPQKDSSLSTANSIRTSTKHPSSEITSKSTNRPLVISTKREISYFTDVSKNTLMPKEPSITRQPNQPNSQNGDMCTSNGFIGDSENCRKFYRCVGNQRGGFIKYEFSCSESTIWDDDIQGCNHPWAVKRSKCGRSLSFDEKSTSYNTQSTPGTSSSKFQEIVTQSMPTTTEQSLTFGVKLNKTIQQQLQISYGTKVTQTQTQIGKGNVMQNQTQINFGDRINEAQHPGAHQNQTQISYGTAISQTQTQIDHGHMGVQTQLQIDHSKASSQTQTQIHDSSSKRTTTLKQDNQGLYSNSNINKVENNVCTESGFLGDSNDCKRFYRCVGNGRGGFTKYEFFCGDGTVWDVEIEACNHAWAVKDCGGKVSTETTIITSTTKSPQNYYPDSSKSTQNYYSTFETSNNEDIDYVSYGHENHQYSTPSPTTQKSTTAENLKEEITECTSSGFIGDANNCKVFYRCVDNGKGSFIKHEFKCGEGTLWDPDIEACNHAWAVKKCGGSMSTHIDKVESTTSKEIIISSTHLPTSVSFIPSTTAAMQSDDYDTGYGSHNDEIHSTIKTTKQPQDQGNNNSNECEASGFMGDKNDCKKFYRCVDNGNGEYIRYEFTCGEGTVWDPKIEACNHAWAVKSCGKNGMASEHQEMTSQSTPTTVYGEVNSGYTTQNYKDTEKPFHTTVSSTETTSMISNENNKCQNSGFMGDHKDCKKFYRCVDNGDGTYTRYEFSCGEGTVWDAKIDACNHAWAVKICGGSNELIHEPQVTAQYWNDDEIGNEYGIQNSMEPDRTTQSSVSKPSNELSTASNENNKCVKIGFSGDKGDCRKFYRCVDDGKGSFIRYEFYCGEGTVWDKSIEACNHESAVNDCGKNNNGNGSMQIQNENTSETMLTWSESDNEGYNHYSTDKTTTAIENYPGNVITSNTCSKEGFFGVKNDCIKFYRCVDNGQGGFIKYEFSCGEGTYWNNEIQACDHALSDKGCNKNDNKSTTKKPQHDNDELYTDTTTKTSISSTSESFLSSSSQKPQISQNICESEGFYGESTDCKRFYRCVSDGKESYIKYDFTCGDGTIWDQEIQACNYESNNNKCSNIASSTQPNETQSEYDKYTSTSSTSTLEQHSTEKTETSSSSPSDQCSSEGFHPNPSDCTKFIRCVINEKGGFIKYEFSCGKGTVWIQEIQACDHDNGITSCDTEIQSTKKPESNNENYHTSSESSISSSTLASPPSTPNREEDDYNDISSESIVSGTEECSAEGFYANKNDCRRFYRCVENNPGKYTKYDFICGEGTAWDSEIQGCNHISEVKNCVNQEESQTKPVMHDEEVSQTTENTSTVKTSTLSAIESSSSSSKGICEKEGYYGNLKDCKKFYRCVDNGKGEFTKYDYTCGDGTIWDQDISACNHPQDVTNPSCNQDQGESATSPSTSSSTSSSSQSSTSTTESSNHSPTNCFQEESSKKPESKNITCSKAGYYANPNDCKKFYRCVDWDGDGKRFSVYHFDCGEGTIWDPAVETCNHEDSVYPPRDCSGAQSQNENVAQGSTSTEGTTTTAETTTQQASTSEQTTIQESTTSEQTTTQQSTTNEQTTTQESITSEQTTTQQSSTSEQTTMQQSTTSEQTTAQQSTTSEQTTTQESTTSEQTTTQESTTSEQTTTQQSTTSEQTTTQQSTTSEQTTTQQSTTSEQTTTQQSTTSEQTITEQSTTSEQTTAQQSTTTEQSTTHEASTSEQTTTATEETTQLSTTEQHTTTDQTTESSNETATEETASSEKQCPDMDSDQYAFVCPTSFRRHPKYCNLFYQCTEDDDSHEVKIALFNCPNNTIYDESKVQCVDEEKADKKCSGEIAKRQRVKRLGATNKEPIMVTREKQKCVAEGYFPFEKDTECSPGFLKCDKSKSGKLRGYVYRCPEGYIYWSISKRCELIEHVRDCKRSTNNWSERWEIPIERKNIALKKTVV